MGDRKNKKHVWTPKVATNQAYPKLHWKQSPTTMTQHESGKTQVLWASQEIHRTTPMSIGYTGACIHGDYGRILG